MLSNIFSKEIISNLLGISTSKIIKLLFAKSLNLVVLNKSLTTILHDPQQSEHVN